MVNKIKEGCIVEVANEHLLGITWVHSLLGFYDTDCYGVVKEVNPTRKVISQYAEINPNANGNGKVIYYDEGAQRHFMINTEFLKVIG